MSLRTLALAAAPLLAIAAGAQPFGLSNRLANTTLTLPAQPPVFGYQFTNAFGTNTFSQPLCIRTPPGESNRVFVVQKGGLIQVVTNIGAASPVKSLYLSLTAGINTTSEQGLLGLAFHPNFQSNGFLYTYRSIRVTNGPTVVTNERLSRFTASPPSAASITTNSEMILFEQGDIAGNHNGGDLHFGSDGYLYIAVGDGGNPQGDGQNNSQTIRKGLNSGVLRIDVDQRPGSLPPNPPSAISLLTNIANYTIPPDNPWVTNVFIHETNRASALETNVRTEFYAVGLRNPWRMAFDPVTGWLYLGDVGGGSREEVDVVTNGGNYGWTYREGFVTGPKAAQTNTWYNASTPAPWATNFAGSQPILDYGRGAAGTNVGNSITGGVVYRGKNLAPLHGAYVFADYGSASPGNVWSLRYNGTNVSQWVQHFADTDLVAFGTDPRNGDVLAADLIEGIVKRLVYSTNFTGTPLPATLANTGAFSDLATLTPHAGIVPYSLNVPSWSDGAVKSHWFSVPDTNLAIGWNPTNNWSFPTGTVWLQHFELVTNHLTQARIRVETRALVRSTGGVYGVTYRWGGNPTNAALVAEGGTNELFVITDPGGILRTQRWNYPARLDCAACHSAPGGFAPGFNTAQLNRSQTFTNFPGATGSTDNQLRTLSAAGYFNPPVSNLNTQLALAPAADAASSLEWRVRSYLAANCAHCHQPAAGNGQFDARIATPTALAGLINGVLNTNLGNTNARVIVPGSTNDSMIHKRIATLGAGRMPPLESTVLDSNNVALVAQWIGSAPLIAYQTFAQWQLAQFGSTNAPNALADADADGGGNGNFTEYLLGTNPNEAADDWKVDIRRSGPDAEIVFLHPANRGFEVQVRNNLVLPPLWTPLDVPGNAPFFPAVTFTNAVADPLGSDTNRTYRVRVFAP